MSCRHSDHSKHENLDDKVGENQAVVLNLKAGERNLVAGGDEKMEADEKVLEGEHKNTKAGAENIVRKKEANNNLYPLSLSLSLSHTHTSTHAC